jgi:uncharacterized protein YdeI (YjbR/CyaY-like superfamily)
METHKDLPLFFFKNQAEWLKWLEKNYETPNGIWIKFAKKHTNITSLTYTEARDGALMYGWIDGLKNRLDDTYFALRFLPRRPKSTWSKINCEIAENLIASGAMKPSGLKEVEIAKADGRWDNAYASQSTIEIPNDLQIALDQNPKAYTAFQSLNKSNRYAFLYRIHMAKRAETRARHIQKTIDMLLSGKSYH